MPNREIPLEEIAAAMPLARAYCEPECQTRVMDSDLVYAAARLLIREGWVPPESAMVEAIDVSNPVSPSMRPKEVRPKVGDRVLVPLRGEMQNGIIQDEHVTYGVKVYDDEGYPEYHIWGCNLVKPAPAPSEEQG